MSSMIQWLINKTFGSETVTEPQLQPETPEQREIALQGIQVPFDCAYQYADAHLYVPVSQRKISVTYQYDGVNVLKDGVTIGNDVLASSAHYGHLGRAGPYEGQSVLKLVKDMYNEHFYQCQLARANGRAIPPMPEPLCFTVTYGGN